LVQFSQLGTARLHLAQLRNPKRVRERGTATVIEVRDLLPLFKGFNADLIRLLLPQLAPIDRVLAENEVALGEAASRTGRQRVRICAITAPGRDLREGNLRETLRQIEGPIDFILSDIWLPMVRPAFEPTVPHLRPRAVVITDNT
jgi:hypothetical protein